MRFAFESAGELKKHLMAYLLAYNFQRPLKAVKYMTPYGKMTGIYEQNPDLFCFDPSQKAVGLNS